ncbi:MAG: DNA repair protein RecO C-terminal domain-containing protein, partial [Lachnospiraceae bacterium]|nr:DNA repair protein RecO C-terminal domain-containing protein [Lachnospiraceae bacterium]
ILCRECHRNGGQVLSESAIYAMQFVISSPIEKLYTFNVSEEVLAELKRTIEQFMRQYIDKNMKSLEILKSMY